MLQHPVNNGVPDITIIAPSIPESSRDVYEFMMIVEWDDYVNQFNGHLHLLEGSFTDITVLREAGAETADRILLMPYSTWQDYRVDKVLLFDVAFS